MYRIISLKGTVGTVPTYLTISRSCLINFSSNSVPSKDKKQLPYYLFAKEFEHKLASIKRHLFTKEFEHKLASIKRHLFTKEFEHKTCIYSKRELQINDPACLRFLLDGIRIGVVYVGSFLSTDLATRKQRNLINSTFCF